MENYFKEYPKEEIKVNLTLRELKNLRLDSKIRLLEDKTLKLNFENEYVVSNIEGEQIKFSLIMTTEEYKNFKLRISRNNYLASGNISYSEILDEYSIENLQLYTILNPLEKWLEIMTELSLTERINEILKILGINPSSLLIHEKIIFIIRLVPLIQKKYLLLDFSTRGLGKSTSYSVLGYSLNTIATTRAAIFYNIQTKETGDFFDSSTCFILDEFQKIDKNDVFKVLQTYKDGDENTGNIVLSSKDIRTSSKSVVLLGNPRTNINFKDLFSKKINIFEGTTLHKQNQEDGDAFLSRVDGYPNSWGCREFSPSMKFEDKNNFYKRHLLNETILELREKEINVEEILNFLPINKFYENSRSATAIKKTFSGLLKLLFPEVITNERINSQDLIFLYELSQEMRKTVNNLLKILKPNENRNIQKNILISERFMYFLQNDMNYRFNIYGCTPHRIIIDLGNGILKIPIDTIGIEQNQTESLTLNTCRIPGWNFDNNTNRLFTLYHINAQLVAWYSNSYFSRNRYYLPQPKEYTPEGVPIFFKNERWDNSLNYNYLTGEEEFITNFPFVRGYSFYDIRIN